MPAQITALPTPPSTNDPANFNTRADAFLGQMPTFVTQANALAGEVEVSKIAAATSASDAAASLAATTSKVSEAAASAASALGAPGTNGTSATSLTIATGTKSFTTQTGKAWIAGQGFFVASTASPLNWMTGILTAYNSGTGAATVEVDAIGGSGTFAAWNCGLAAGRPLAVATQAQAEAGTDNATIMTPLRSAQAGSPGLDAYFFGDGVDGDVTISSAVTLTRDMYYNNLTLVAGAAITTNGWRIFVKRVLDLSAAPAGAIRGDGAAGADGSGAFGGAGGQSLPANFLGGVNGGGSGGNGLDHAAPSIGGASTNSPNHLGGQSGAAGKGGDAWTTGALGAVPAIMTPQNLIRRPEVFQPYWPFNNGLLSGGQPGPGGGGGSTDYTNRGGGGGGGGTGGGCVVVFARTIARGASTAVSAIRASGGKGGKGGAGVRTSVVDDEGTPIPGGAGGGGGSGGGGGWAYIVCWALSGATAANAIDVSGGDGGGGGAGGGSSPAGAAGAAGGGGRARLMVLSANTTTILSPTSPIAASASPSTVTVVAASQRLSL